MKFAFAAVLAAVVAVPACAQTPASDADGPETLTPDEEAKAFAAAGFAKQDGRWTSCPEDETASYTPGAIDFVGDVNGDGRPEATISESSSFCYGFAGMGYSVVSRQADGSWKLLSSGIGVARFLETKGTGGWPDLEIGDPGFCFPVQRWNGKEYAFNRGEYEGKRCALD